MNVLICPDKFKGSMTALDVCNAVKVGIARFSPNIQIDCHPLADGGDGMLDILVENLGLNLIELEVKDPLFRPVTACYGISKSGTTAFVEMSRASGLVLLTESERNCLETSSYGTGELILDALKRGVTKVVLGMGGSATNDAGIGVAAALGYRFLDTAGEPLSPVGKNLPVIAHIDKSTVVPELTNVQIDLASDVQSPFYGTEGAAYTFGFQKGADDRAVKLLDQGLRNMARLVEQTWGINLQDIPGSGAAGGLGGGCMAFLNAELKSGIDMIMEITGLESRVKTTDLVITGEGKLDDQTLSGKVVDGVVRLAKKHRKPVAVLCGSCSLSEEEWRNAGIDYCDQILKNSVSVTEAMSNGQEYLKERAYHLMITLQAPV